MRKYSQPLRWGTTNFVLQKVINRHFVWKGRWGSFHLWLGSSLAIDFVKKQSERKLSIKEYLTSHFALRTLTLSPSPQRRQKNHTPRVLLVWLFVGVVGWHSALAPRRQKTELWGLAFSGCGGGYPSLLALHHCYKGQRTSRNTIWLRMFSAEFTILRFSYKSLLHFCHSISGCIFSVC